MQCGQNVHLSNVKPAGASSNQLTLRRGHNMSDDLHHIYKVH
jgi:hypothetical protein